MIEIEGVGGRVNPMEVDMRMRMVIVTKERTGILVGVLMFLEQARRKTMMGVLKVREGRWFQRRVERRY